MLNSFPVLSDQDISNIVNNINTQGFGVADNYIAQDSLYTLQSFIQNKVTQAGGQYVAFTGAEDMKGLLLEEIGNSPEFQSVCHRIYEKGTGKKAPQIPFYQVLRCLAGDTGKKHAYFFHYDSYDLTALLPIVMPKEGQKGDLLMIPNSRGFRKTYLANLIDKVMLDNKITQQLLSKQWIRTLLRFKKISMTPGNIYFFWGTRSIHANEPCDPDKIRATALFHYVDPHSQSWLRQKLRPNMGVAKH